MADFHFWVDSFTEGLKHPFFAVFMGIGFFFCVKWSFMRNREKIKSVGFFNDQKDEMVVAIVGGLLFLVWDDELISLYNNIVVPNVTFINLPKTKGEELQPYHYLLVGPATEAV